MLDRKGAASPVNVAFVEDEDAVTAQILALADAGVTAQFARGSVWEGTRRLLKAVTTGS